MAGIASYTISTVVFCVYTEQPFRGAPGFGEYWHVAGPITTPTLELATYCKR
jgi:hypothetical protein